MKLLSHKSALLAATTLLAVSPATAEKITDFQLKPVGKGEVFTLSEAEGKYVALHFLLETECPICLRHTRDHYLKAKNDEDLVQVFIKPDEEAATAKWITGFGENQPTIHRDPDGELAKKLTVPMGYKFHGIETNYPTTIVINPEGEEIFRKVGENNRVRLTWEELETVIKTDQNENSNEKINSEDIDKEKTPESKPSQASQPASQPASRPVSK